MAAVWVVIYHLYPYAQRAFHGPLLADVPVARSGYLAVDLFFILSGFVLGLTSYGAFSRNGGEALQKFAIGRVFRILPLNGAMLLILLALTQIFPGPQWSQAPLTWSSFVASLFLVQSWGFGVATNWNAPAWSLSTEWAAYILFPAAILFLTVARGARIALIGFLGALACLLGTMIAVGDSTLDHVFVLGLVRCMFEFMAGVFLWRCVATGIFARIDPRLLLAIGCTGVVAVVAFPVIQLIIPIAFSLIIVACAAGTRPADMMFANRPALFLGEISFSLYLSHYILLCFFDMIAMRYGIYTASAGAKLAFFAVMPIAILSFSYLSWRLIEMPSQAGGKAFLAWLRRERPSKPVTSASRP